MKNIQGCQQGLVNEMFNRRLTAQLSQPETKVKHCRCCFWDDGIMDGIKARIIYELGSRQQGKIKQAGFAYGTTMGHIAIGEELFHVDWNLETNEVYFRITVFSRPGSLLAWIGKPYMLYQQKKFRRMAAQAISTKCKKNRYPRVKMAATISCATWFIADHHIYRAMDSLRKKITCGLKTRKLKICWHDVKAVTRPECFTSRPSFCCATPCEYAFDKQIRQRLG